MRDYVKASLVNLATNPEYRMSRTYLAVGSALLVSTGCVTQHTAPTTDADHVPLPKVIEQVNLALKEYQSNRGTGETYELPPLSSAEFDFKTTTATVLGGTVTVLILKFGVSHENDLTNDVTFTYSLPKPQKGTTLESEEPPPSLKDQLAQAIQSAAKSIKGASTAAGLPFSKLTVNIQYGVKWDGNAGVTAPVSLVTLGLTGDVNRNTIQSVKLVFGSGTP
jgi:hypothetical protein